MSTKLTSEQVTERINQLDAIDGNSEEAQVIIRQLLAHITALEEELKAAQENSANLLQTLETRAERELEMLAVVERESVNGFRARLFQEAQRQAFSYSINASDVIELIQTFEAESNE